MIAKLELPEARQETVRITAKMFWDLGRAFKIYKFTVTKIKLCLFYRF